MDIQEMVNARIEELRNQAMKSASSTNMASNGNQLTPAYREELEQLGSVMEEALTGIACRVLEITEQVSGDYARLEKELLNSRLALLQSAETVLDMALSLKNQARKVIETGLETHPRAEALSGERSREAFHAEQVEPESMPLLLSEMAEPQYSARSWELEADESCPVCSGRAFPESGRDDGLRGSGRASMMNNGVADLFRKTQN